MSKIYTSEEVSDFLDSVSPERRDELLNQHADVSRDHSGMGADGGPPSFELLTVSGIPWSKHVEASNLLSAAIEKAKPFPLKKTQP